MKTKKSFRTACCYCLLLLFAAGCTLDNYESPDTVISGIVVEEDTYAPFQTQTPNGAKVRFYEKYNGVWSAQPYDVWVHQDGTFSNNAAFSGEYKVVAEGAFSPVDTQIIRIADAKKLAIRVRPYLNIDITARAGDGRVSVNAKITKKADGAGKIETIAFMLSNTPNVDYNAWMKKGGQEDLSLTSDSDIIGVEYAFSFSGLDSGRKYYARVGALTNNPASAWNYSEVVEVKAE
jgi:hypothetical protein